MSTRPTKPATDQTPELRRGDVAEMRERRIRERRAQFRDRHALALTGLLGERTDLRGVHALADLVDDSVRWSA